ncbi:Fe2+-dependent dioxygenase [Nisaea acidiphila]|uniref:Fe2+-dependent dioxygenase n=1 Tax=Nisaea acidiphila TaxID=1862145 RepID=A0A9J7AXY5_9PROT|nr:Fe2+-dependent dioxygenase [Nisaea acidiphila]UUX51124.1 Fe2+-dependent dioxygenase [Nisaea acidiphila]
MPYVYPIPNLLPPELVSEINKRLESEPEAWVDGAQTAGRERGKKKNLELAVDSDLRVQVSDAITTVLRDYQRRESLLFTFLAAPSKIGKFLVSSTDAGGGYGDHMDNNVMGKGTAEELRSDLSMTIFLSDPESYEGGELVIDSDMAFAPSFKMPAGGAVLYATNSIHRVNPVTKGTRVAAITWIESEIADPFMRQVNADLLQCLNAVSLNGEQNPQLAAFLTLKLEKIRGNLQKRFG